jgi:hypothetical protein
LSFRPSDNFERDKENHRFESKNRKEFGKRSMIDTPGGLGLTSEASSPSQYKHLLFFYLFI